MIIIRTIKTIIITIRNICHVVSVVCPLQSLSGTRAVLWGVIV